MRCSSVPSAAPDCRCFGDQIADLLLGAVVQRAERAVGGPVGGDLVLGEPAAVDVAEQVVLGAGVGVDVAQVDSGLEVRGSFYRHPDILPETSRYPHAHARRRAGAASREAQRSGVFSGYGIASAVLGVVAVAAVVLAGVIWTRSSWRRRGAEVSRTGAADRRRLDRRAHQHEQGHRRGRHGHPARRHRRRAERGFRDQRRALPQAGADAAGEHHGQIDSVAIETIHH